MKVKSLKYEFNFDKKGNNQSTINFISRNLNNKNPDYKLIYAID